jgi:YegS/Rv2252/BmrU family lipid kinase
MEKAVIIINPEARNSKRFENKRVEVLKILSEFYDVYIWETIKQGDGIRLAQRALDFGACLMISAGGDGTLNEVINGCAGSSIKIGILPLGVSNVFALYHRIPVDVVKAVKVIAKGKVKEVDLGFVNGKRYFHMVLGAGLDGFVVHNLPHDFKKAFGAPAYVVTGFAKYPVYELRPINIKIDDVNYGTAYEVVVSNIPNYGGRMKMAPDAIPDDGLLDVVIFREGGFLNDVGYFMGVLLGIHHKLGSVEIYKGKKIELEGNDVYYHLDAEPCGKIPVKSECKPRMIKVIVP